MEECLANVSCYMCLLAVDTTVFVTLDETKRRMDDSFHEVRRLKAAVEVTCGLFDQ